MRRGNGDHDGAIVIIIIIIIICNKSQSSGLRLHSSLLLAPCCCLCQYLPAPTTLIINCCCCRGLFCFLLSSHRYARCQQSPHSKNVTLPYCLPPLLHLHLWEWLHNLLATIGASLICIRTFIQSFVYSRANRLKLFATQAGIIRGNSPLPSSTAPPLLAKFNHVNDVLMGAGQQNKLY